MFNMTISDEAVLAAIAELKIQMTQMSDQIDALTKNVANIESVEASVKAFVEGVPGLIATAVNAAIAAGATPTELAAFADLNSRLTADAAKIASDVVTPSSAPQAAPFPTSPAAPAAPPAPQAPTPAATPAAPPAPQAPTPAATPEATPVPDTTPAVPAV